MLFAKWSLLLVALAALVGESKGQVFGTVRGTVEDAQHLPISGVKVTLKAAASTYVQHAETDQNGAFTATAVPGGTYTVQVESEGFQTITQPLNLTIGSAPVLKLTMELATVAFTVQVNGTPLEAGNPDASSPPVIVGRTEIEQTPGADRSSSLAFITDFVPGSYLLHDHLHMRGGHQVSWLVDGVPVPNTNISSNVGRALDPKDMETVEVSRGGYSSKYGDRTYGMINIIPRSGFEFSDRTMELTTTYGSMNQTNDQLNFGGHSLRLAYYGSLTGNRSDLGLEPPTEQVIHNQGSGLAGFTTLEYVLANGDQLRLAASLRKDFFQVPNTPVDQSLGVRDTDQEIDSFVNFSWVHALDPGILLTVSPLYHYNRAQYTGGPNDPLVTNDDRASQYVGAQATLGVVRGEHNFTVGVYGFREHDDRIFHLADQAGLFINETEPVTGGVATLFFDEQYKPYRWVTLNAGMRLTHFSGKVSENAADPRLGGSIHVPKLKWVLRGFFGLYYQPPPLETIAGPVLNFALQEGINFLPVHGERDQQHEYGVTIPWRGWTADFAHFRTAARNFSDHDVLGNSNITLPLSIQSVTVRGWEAVIRSPQLGRHTHFHLAYSNQVVKGQGAITGGLTGFKPPEEGFFYIDHDQRHTLTTGTDFTLPRRAWLSTDVVFGSGFLDQNGPQHLPPHTSVDLSLGKSFRENWSFTLSALNVGNNRFLFGQDSAFAGTHYNEPRQFIASLRYRFHF